MLSQAIFLLVGIWATFEPVMAFGPASRRLLVRPATSSQTVLSALSSSDDSSDIGLSRRVFLDTTRMAGLVATSALLLPMDQALASGGATAGGAYLLSAKQRYNERVKGGVRAFLGLRSALEGGDIDTVRTFFTKEEEGGWKDLSAAGYLLANAFRRNSTAAPDSLPSVKKWKAFAAQVENMTKSLKKKDTKGALAVYEDAVVALDAYLEQVELPSSKAI